MPQARLSEETYAVVTRIANETGATQQEIIDRAVRMYERERFFAELNSDFERLQANPDAWAEFEAERAEWDAMLEGQPE